MNNNNSTKKVVTRIAPSPTGNLHVGTARSALFNYLYARQHNGTFIVRVEDTDKVRSTKEYEKDILEGLAWLGFDHDALYRQSENTARYTQALTQLVENKLAYVSLEPSKQDESKHVEVVRLKNEGKKITFNDTVRGDITFDTTDLGDFVIARSMTDPLYHLTVVVDDHDMEVTHVIRGEDHISNTPRQILIQEALGFTRPVYVHMPLILAPDRSKLSKRKGETSISVYAKDYLSEALVNYLALLGWNPGTEQEIFSMEELIDAFSFDKMQKGGAIFDIEKLKSINGEHLKKIPAETFKTHIENALPETLRSEPLYSSQRVDKIIPVVKERVRTFGEITEMIEDGELTFYFVAPALNQTAVCWKDDAPELTKRHLDKLISIVSDLDKEFDEEKIKEAVWEYASAEGRGSVLWPMRYSLSGKEKSPDPFSIASVLGKEETISRLEKALAQL